MTEPSARPVLPVVGVMSCIALHLWLCAAAASEVALDVDTANLLYAIDRFDIAHQAPHPPGYLLYVVALRGVHGLLAGAPIVSTQWLAWLCSSLTIALGYRLVRRVGGSIAGGLIAALLCALHPFLIFHGVDAQTHNAEALSSVLLLLALTAHTRRARAATAVALGLCLALGVGLRPSFAVAAVLPVLAATRATPVHLAMLATVALAGSLLWIVPTVQLSGGLDAFVAANDAFVGGAFLAHGPLSGGSAAGMLPALAYTGLLLAPLLATWLLCDRAVTPGEAALRRWSFLMAAGAVPFYLLTYCSEPGYLQALVPPLAVWLALRVAAAPRPGLALLVALAAQLAVLVLPAGREFKWPSLVELVQREVAGRAYLQAARKSVADGRPTLVITDFPGQAIQRQLPQLDADLDVLWLFWPMTSNVPTTSLAYGTATDLLPIPGPALLMDGPAKVARPERAYAFVALDPFVSEPARAQLRGQTPCAIPARGSDGRFHVMPASCFASGSLQLGSHGIRLLP